MLRRNGPEEETDQKLKYICAGKTPCGMGSVTWTWTVYKQRAWTHGAEEGLVTVQVLTLLVDAVDTAWILVVGDDVLRRLGQQTVGVLAARKPTDSLRRFTSYSNLRRSATSAPSLR